MKELTLMTSDEPKQLIADATAVLEGKKRG